jgi:hypothetical protein
MALSSLAAPAAPQQQVIGAGIAGVASKREQEGIKTYNDQKKYNRWEFIYDVTKDPTKVAQTGAPGAPGATGAAGASGAQGQPGATSTSTTPSPMTAAPPATATQSQ